MRNLEMSIKIIKEPDIHVTEGELQRYQEEYQSAYSMYCGPIPTLEEYIRMRKKQKKNENQNTRANDY